MKNILSKFFNAIICTFLISFTLSGMEEKEATEPSQKFAIFDRQPWDRSDLADQTKEIFNNISDKKKKYTFYIGQINYINSSKWIVSPYYNINKKLVDQFWGLKTNASTINLQIEEYKIHLMPKTTDIPKHMEQVLNLISNDENLQKGIFLVKALIGYPEEQYELEQAPKIVIYVYGKDNAQDALNKIYDNFKNEKGSGQVPAYNEKVTNFIYIAQGDRNDKKRYSGTIPGPYESPNLVYFDPKNINNMWPKAKIDPNADYHLINPAKAEKRRGTFEMPQPITLEQHPEEVIKTGFKEEETVQLPKPGLKIPIETAVSQLQLKSQEDRYAVKENFETAKYGIYGVFDGHAGADAVTIVAKELLPAIVNNLLKASHHERLGFTKPREIETALLEAFEFTEKTLNNAQVKGGSTAIVCFIDTVGKKIYAANVGDSRAVMSRGGQALALSSDQKCDRPDEKERIRNAGGSILYHYINSYTKKQIFSEKDPDPKDVDKGRIVARLGGNLAMSRSLGDFDLKKSKFGQGLISTPEIQLFDITNEDEFIILATDGVWDALTNQEAVDIVRNSLQQNSSIQNAANILVNNAKLQRGKKNLRSDDITALIIRLKPFLSKEKEEVVESEKLNKFAQLDRFFELKNRILEEIENLIKQFDFSKDLLPYWNLDDVDRWEKSLERMFGVLNEVTLSVGSSDKYHEYLRSIARKLKISENYAVDRNEMHFNENRKNLLTKIQHIRTKLDTLKKELNDYRKQLKEQ